MNSIPHLLLLTSDPGVLADVSKEGSVCWWHMACGRVLGVHNNMLLEYDPSTLAPLGLVVAKDELNGRQVAAEISEYL